MIVMTASNNPLLLVHTMCADAQSTSAVQIPWKSWNQPNQPNPERSAAEVAACKIRRTLLAR